MLVERLHDGLCGSLRWWLHFSVSIALGDGLCGTLCCLVQLIAPVGHKGTNRDFSPGSASSEEFDPFELARVAWQRRGVQTLLPV
jgi:hypothetical protein